MTHPNETAYGNEHFAHLPPLENLRRRDALLTSMRSWFHANGFHEVETPVRIPFPAPEPNIDCPASSGAWLRASPELQMKRLLAAGDDRIFQIGPCFRERERGARHNPEFTMLEWYRRGASSADILDDCASLIRQAVCDLAGGMKLTYRGTSIDFDGEWLFPSVTPSSVSPAGILQRTGMQTDSTSTSRRKSNRPFPPSVPWCLANILRLRLHSRASSREIRWSRNAGNSTSAAWKSQTPMASSRTGRSSAAALWRHVRSAPSLAKRITADSTRAF